MTETASDLLPAHASRSIRHPLVFRTLEVLRVERVSPHMQRIVCGGDELCGFVTSMAESAARHTEGLAEGQGLLEGRRRHGR